MVSLLHRVRFVVVHIPGGQCNEANAVFFVVVKHVLENFDTF